ncbi:hypothetical protein DQ097_24370, partial [Salmonella enterica subsp. enterica serovar Goverdhan]|nr:hypothetical protein [Salmonella enterica subsp. enterica serovar Goverdhan]
MNRGKDRLDRCLKEAEDIVKKTYYIKRIVIAGLAGIFLTIMLSALITWCKLVFQTRHDLTELSENSLYTVEGYLAEA